MTMKNGNDERYIHQTVTGRQNMSNWKRDYVPGALRTLSFFSLLPINYTIPHVPDCTYCM